MTTTGAPASCIRRAAEAVTELLTDRLPGRPSAAATYSQQADVIQHQTRRQPRRWGKGLLRFIVPGWTWLGWVQGGLGGGATLDPGGASFHEIMEPR